MLLHCLTWYSKLNQSFRNQLLWWPCNRFLKQFALWPSGWWPSSPWLIFYIACCKEFMLPSHTFLFWRSFLAKLLLQIFNVPGSLSSLFVDVRLSRHWQQLVVQCNYLYHSWFHSPNLEKITKLYVVYISAGVTRHFGPPVHLEK